MLSNNPFSSWSNVVTGAICFATLFELPLIMMDYLIEGTVGLSWATLGFGAAAFLGYLVVGGAIMRYSGSPDVL
jgi:hypothetical protein